MVGERSNRVNFGPAGAKQRDYLLLINLLAEFNTAQHFGNWAGFDFVAINPRSN